MKRWILAGFIGMCVALAAPATATAATIFIDFEGLTEFDPPTAPGVTFTNALVLTSGAIGGVLNELDFPPKSDFNVAFDAGGPIRLSLASLAQSFSGFFTYTAPLTVTAFNGVTVVGTVTSSTGNNTGSVGTPNELLSLSIPGGFNRLEFLGAQGGGSFVVDDITLAAPDVVAPEPATLWLLGLGAAAVARRRSRIQPAA